MKNLCYCVPALLGLLFAGTTATAANSYFGPRVNGNTLMWANDSFSSSNESRITSTNGYALVVQRNCDLGYYHNSSYLGWHAWSGMVGIPTSCALAMQTDGNLVLYVSEVKCGWIPGDCDSGWYVEWSSGTYGNPGAFLLAQTDGNMVIYAPNGVTPLWSIWYGRAY